MISVVCVYNDAEKFQSCAVKSLREQTIKHELIAIDNTKNSFHSAAEALNFGAAMATQDESYLVFLHQDIDLNDSECLEKIEQTTKTINQVGVVGGAGVTEGKSCRILTNILHGNPLIGAGTMINKPVEVVTVDECFFMVPKPVFKQYQFDEAICDGWHLYATEYCLRIKEKGLKVYVIPMGIYHRTGYGNPINGSYFKILKKIVERYKDSYERINTCCGSWSVNSTMGLQRMVFIIKKVINQNLIRLIDRGLMPERFMMKRWKRLAEERCVANNLRRDNEHNQS
jgi:GT2 family glycosyltransferase